MNFNLDLITANAIVVVPIVIALTQAIKLTGWVKDHYVPLVSIGIGVIVGFLTDHNNPDLTTGILSGAVYGLMASGLYSGVKTTMLAHSRLKAERMKKSANKNNQNNQNDY